MWRVAIVGMLWAGPAAGQSIIVDPPAELKCQIEWRRLSTELNKPIIRMVCNGGRFSAGLAQVYNGAALWEGVLACRARDCGRDKIAVYSETPIPDGHAVTCREVGKLLPREWSCLPRKD